MSHADFIQSVLHSVLSWSSVLGGVVVPFFVGLIFERKLDPSMPRPGSRLPRRY